MSHWNSTGDLNELCKISYGDSNWCDLSKLIDISSSLCLYWMASLCHLWHLADTPACLLFTLSYFLDRDTCWYVHNEIVFVWKRVSLGDITLAQTIQQSLLIRSEGKIFSCLKGLCSEGEGGNLSSSLCFKQMLTLPFICNS